MRSNFPSGTDVEAVGSGLMWRFAGLVADATTVIAISEENPLA
jgi:hypothetical protein